MAQAIPTPLRTFTNDKGRTFAVRVLPAGARYGAGNRSVTDRAEVEFYDTTHADDAGAHNPAAGFGPIGQFVSRYHFGTLITHSGGLTLDGGVPEWSLDAATMKQVTLWLSDPQVVTRTVQKR